MSKTKKGRVALDRVPTFMGEQPHARPSSVPCEHVTELALGESEILRLMRLCLRAQARESPMNMAPGFCGEPEGRAVCALGLFRCRCFAWGSYPMKDGGMWGIPRVKYKGGGVFVLVQAWESRAWKERSPFPTKQDAARRGIWVFVCLS